MTRQRIASLDLIRTVALLLATMLLVLDGLQLNRPSADYVICIYQALSLMGVPLFFMLSGALLLDGEPLPISQFLSRRFKRLLLPYLFWGTLVYGIFAMTSTYPNIQDITDALRNYVPYLLTGKIAPAYWFVFVFIGLYLFTPFMQRALSDSHLRRLMELILALWAVWFMLRYPQFNSINYREVSAIVYLGFFVAGHYCMRYLTDECRNRRIGAVGLILSYILNVLGLVNGFSITITYVTGAVSLFLLLKSFTVPCRFTPFITSTGRYAYAVYLMQVLFIDILCRHNAWDWYPIWLCPIIVALVSFAVCWLVAWALEHIRLISNTLIGI